MTKVLISTNTSGYRGVFPYQYDSTRWQAKIVKDGKQIYIGIYKTAGDAAKAYDRKALELFGENAILNEQLYPELHFYKGF